MTTEQTTILSRIRKLQSLTTERGATPEEAASAAAKAQALLFEHNLAQSDVETTEAAPDPYGKVEHTLEGANRSTVQWRRNLLYTIAKHNFCLAVTLPNTTKMSLVGKRSNVETVLYLNQCVSRQIDELAAAAAKTQLTNRAQYRVSFCRGAMMTIHARLKEQRRQNEATATAAPGVQGNRNAVMLRTADTELKTTVAKFYPNLRYTTSRGGGGSGYEEGKAAGANIGMHQGITGGRPSGYLS